MAWRPLFTLVVPFSPLSLFSRNAVVVFSRLRFCRRWRRSLIVLPLLKVKSDGEMSGQSFHSVSHWREWMSLSVMIFERLFGVRVCRSLAADSLFKLYCVHLTINFLSEERRSSIQRRILRHRLCICKYRTQWLCFQGRSLVVKTGVNFQTVGTHSGLTELTGYQQLDTLAAESADKENYLGDCSSWMTVSNLRCRSMPVLFVVWSAFVLYLKESAHDYQSQAKGLPKNLIFSV